MRRTHAGRTTPALLLAVLAVACSDDPIALPADESAGPGFAVSFAPFSDGFDVFDASRWSAEEHPLGRGWLRSANVSVQSGILRLATPRSTYDGAEVASLERYGAGSFTARMRCALPAGSLCAFFLYEGVPGDRNDEIDIELISGTRTMWMTTWVRGRQTNHAEVTLPFDPAAEFHEYRIDYSSSEVAFRVDGMLHQRWTRKLPRRAMRLLANAWWPTWLSAPMPAQDAFMEIDRIDAN